MTRTRGWALLLFVAAALVLGPGAARGDEPAPPADPWPLAGAAPAQGGESARATIHAADARRQSFALARTAAAFEDAVAVPVPGDGTAGPGRVAIPPALAVRGLRAAAERSNEGARRTVPDMMHVLSAVAFDGTANAPERPILLGADGKVDRIFQGRFQPTSIDDRPYVLQPSRLERLRRMPPAPPPPPTSAAKSPAAELVVRGVRIDVDEDLLRRAMARAEVLSPDRVLSQDALLDQLEDRLLAAEDGEAAVLALTAFADERKAALLLGVEDGGRDDGLRRVSLKALVDAAGSIASATATCGGLTRILGVSCAPDGSDVALVGVVQPGAPAVPLDALVLALRCVWREGRVPGCSLDASPRNPGGPQAVRVFGVPGDSRFAKTMLDADYAMKKVVGRSPGGEHGIEGLVDLPAALRRVGGMDSNNRFWLTPVPPARGDVLAAPGAPAALFRARVRVRTEGMQTAAFGTEEGTGAGLPAAEMCARSMTEHYDALAVRLPVFAELRGLFDAVTCAQVLRILAPSHPLLSRAADLPYVKAEIARAYAGITVTHVEQGVPITLQGGCELDARISERAFLDAPHPAFARLLVRGGDGPLPGSVAAGAGVPPEVDDGLLAAARLLGARRHAEAYDLLSDLLDQRPDDAEILALRAVARFRASKPPTGERHAALLDAAEAAALDPASPALEASWRNLRMEADDPQALEGLSPAVGEALEVLCVTAAASLALEGRWKDAVATSGRAVRARPESSRARTLRATVLWLSGDLLAATGVAAEAAALDPTSAEPLTVSAWIAIQRGDAPAAVGAMDRAVALERTAETLGTRALAKAVAGDLASGAEDAAAAVALDASERAVGHALDAFRLLAVYGKERGRALLGAQLMLPSDVQLALYEGQEAMATSGARAAAEAFRRARQSLLTGKVPEERLRSSLGLELVSMLEARALMGLLHEGPQARERIAALAADLEARRPDWISPHWIRAQTALKSGDMLEAIDLYQRCREGDPAKDGVLAQSFPPDAAAMRGILSILEVGLLFALPEAEARPRLPGAVDRLVSAYERTPSAPAAESLRTVLADLVAASSAPKDTPKTKDTALRDALREKAARLPPPGPMPPSEVMVQAFFYAFLVGAEQDAGGDAASALRALRTLASQPDIYEPVTNLVVLSRQQALAQMLTSLLATAQLGASPADLDELAVEDPARAKAFMARVFAPVRAKAGVLGDPILTWLVEETDREAWEQVLSRGSSVRLGRIERVLEVATDPAKIARLAGARDALKADLAGAEQASKERLATARKEILGRLRTPSDVMTFEKLLSGRSSQEDERAAALAPGAEDAKRLAEVRLATSLGALGVPLPESLK